jgi:L,D-peptidoglycan transpeptidase YkuD (ErfK/YbiS/YcfS/YnhG family)
MIGARGSVMFGLAPNPGVGYAYHRIVCGDWWVDDSSSLFYNRFRHVPCGTQPLPYDERGPLPLADGG